MRSILALTLTLALVGGCNQIFGLDPPVAGGTDALDVDALSDRDSDGVLDGVDLCPDVADPDQHDEDGDGRGDRCDLCPHVDQASDVDGDGDGIPDTCDPLPATSGGRLRWSGFHADEDALVWNLTGAGTAIWRDDDVVISPSLDAEVRYTRQDVEPPRSRTAIYVSLNVGAPNAGGIARRTVGVITNLAQNDYFLCQIETDLPVTEVRLADYRLMSGTATTIQSASVGPMWPAGNDMVLELDLNTSEDVSTARTAFCRGSAAAGSASLPETIVADLLPGFPGVRVVGVPVNVHWVAIVDHP